jgi:hypothetical protein
MFISRIVVNIIVRHEGDTLNRIYCKLCLKIPEMMWLKHELSTVAAIIAAIILGALSIGLYFLFISV